jgi:hypothetical protein
MWVTSARVVSPGREAMPFEDVSPVVSVSDPYGTLCARVETLVNLFGQVIRRPVLDARLLST